MKPRLKFWALAVGRILQGEFKPGRLVERVELNQLIRAEEGAQIDHPRLGRIALFTDKRALAQEAVSRMNAARVSRVAFLKQYGHWLEDPELRKAKRQKVPRYIVSWPPKPFTLANAMRPAETGVMERTAANEVYDYIRRSPPGFLPSGFAREFMRRYGHLLNGTTA